MNASNDELTQFEPEYPTNKVVGVFEGPERIWDAIAALKETKVDTESVEVLSNQFAEQRLREAQEGKPLKSRIVDFLFAAGEEAEELNRYNRWLDDGHYVVQVPVEDDDQARQVADILEQHGGHYINYFSRFTVTHLVR